MDHGALGTAIVGLEAVRRNQELSDTPVARRPRTARGHGLRVALAGALRSLADLVEPSRRASSPSRA